MLEVTFHNRALVKIGPIGQTVGVFGSPRAKVGQTPACAEHLWPFLHRIVAFAVAGAACDTASLGLGRVSSGGLR